MGHVWPIGKPSRHFMHILRLVLATVIWATSAPSFAAFSPTPTNWTTSSAYPATTAESSCTQFAKATWASNGTGVLSGPGPTSYTCTPYAGTAAGPTGNTVGTGSGACPANSTLTNSQCSCNADYVQSGSTCVSAASACSTAKGKVAIVNVTLGYTRTPASSDLSYVGTPSGPIGGTEGCNAGCSVQFGTGAESVTAFYVSKTPTAQGLYRNSADYVATGNGTACTAPDKAAVTNPSTAAPACPGFVGDINGVKGCYGTADKPINVTQGTRPTVDPVPGNPSAGTMPSTGEGSTSGGTGRTPSTGTGENNGGPASSAAGAPTGNTTSPPTGEQQLNCGAPGQPKCRIDESGTGDGKTAFDSAKGELTTNGSASKTAIDGAASMQAPTWSFTFQLPTGCTSYNTGIKGFVMNPCSVQPVIHDLMSMIWAAVTAFFIIGLVGRTIREA